VLSTDGQPMTVAGAILHVFVARSQNGTPLHRSPSSLLTHSSSLLHGQLFLPAWHAPCLQASSEVHGLPSSQGPPSALAIIPQSPVLGAQRLVLQGEFATVGQVTTVAGLRKHWPTA